MDAFLFIAFPYLALVLAIGVGIYRYYTNRYTYSSLASQKEPTASPTSLAV